MWGFNPGAGIPDDIWELDEAFRRSKNWLHNYRSKAGRPNDSLRAVHGRCTYGRYTSGVPP